jgi:TPR repeat protein
MYESGQGVTQDFVEAHAWLNLASANEKPGETFLSKMRDNLASKMSPSQLEKAQNRAKTLSLEIHSDKSTITP